MAWDEELQVAMAAARTAGDVMLDYRANGFDLDRKSAYTDIVTEADVACEEAIVDAITEQFPGDGFRTEEDTAAAAADRVWVIDPIDGTKNFVHGFPFYCTSIALVADGASQVGVVYNPVTDTMFHAVRGEGAYRNGKELSVSAVDDLRDALVFTRLSERHAETRALESPFLLDLLSTPSSFRRPGSAALNCAYVAAGEADGYATISINEWDIAAGRLLIEEAGGTCRVQDSVRDGYLEFVGSNGDVHAALLELIDEHIHGHSI